ncbi:uncharacterized protein LOC112548875 [Alligator sinensis]|uniref:Uncharacterized protein LOC112548875 n=1 Tax=Alligator sinensis TaxID=38654 RepID=A0A3Q0FZ77_ALLSI|nr:uncharacterized protein LOC112548875 [Alligator sinensis]
MANRNARLRSWACRAPRAGINVPGLVCPPRAARTRLALAAGTAPGKLRGNLAGNDTGRNGARQGAPVRKRGARLGANGAPPQFPAAHARARPTERLRRGQESDQSPPLSLNHSSQSDCDEGGRVLNPPPLAAANQREQGQGRLRPGPAHTTLSANRRTPESGQRKRETLNPAGPESVALYRASAPSSANPDLFPALISGLQAPLQPQAGSAEQPLFLLPEIRSTGPRAHRLSEPVGYLQYLHAAARLSPQERGTELGFIFSGFRLDAMPSLQHRGRHRAA